MKDDLEEFSITYNGNVFFDYLRLYCLLSLRTFEYIKSALTSLFFSSNIYFYLSATDYGSENSLFIPLLHTWSLGIEEQFYLIFPLLAVLFLRRNYPIKRFLFILQFYLWIAIILTQLNQPLSFYNPLSRFWEILVGSLIAYYEVFQNDKFEVLRSKFLKQVY